MPCTWVIATPETPVPGTAQPFLDLAEHPHRPVLGFDVAWHPPGPEHATQAYTPLYRVWCGSKGLVCLPLGLDGGLAWGARAGRVGYGTAQVRFTIEDGALALDIDAERAEYWLYVVLGLST